MTAIKIEDADARGFSITLDGIEVAIAERHLEPGDMLADARWERVCSVLAAGPDLLDAIDQVTAALETCMAHYGDQMGEPDRRSRTLAIAAARKAQANAEGYQTWADALAEWNDE